MKAVILVLFFLSNFQTIVGQRDLPGSFSFDPTVWRHFISSGLNPQRELNARKLPIFETVYRIKNYKKTFVRNRDAGDNPFRFFEYSPFYAGVKSLYSSKLFPWENHAAQAWKTFRRDITRWIIFVPNFMGENSNIEVVPYIESRRIADILKINGGDKYYTVFLYLNLHNLGNINVNPWPLFVEKPVARDFIGLGNNLDRFARGFERVSYKPDTNTSYRPSPNRGHEHPKSPVSHFLLGLKILYGAFGFFCGLYYFLYAFRHHDRITSDRGALYVLLGVFCIFAGGGVCILGIQGMFG